MTLAAQVLALATRAGAEVKANRPLSSRLTAAATSNVVAYAATGLTVPLTAGKVYQIDAWGHYRTAATTTGLGLRLNGAGGLTVTGIRYTTTIWNGPTPQPIVSAALAGANLTPAVVAANTDYTWEVHGLIRVLAAGNLLVEFASEVAGSLVTLQPDGYLLTSPVT